MEGGGVDIRGREALANATRGVMVIYGKAFADWVCHPTKGGGVDADRARSAWLRYQGVVDGLKGERNLQQDDLLKDFYLFLAGRMG